MSDEIYHTCRWCKNYHDGYCCIQAFDPINLYDLREEQLLDAIRKGLNAVKGFNISVEALAALEDALYGSVGFAISAFEDSLEEKTGIADPETFYCKEFL